MFFLSLFFIFNNAYNFYIVKLYFKFIDGGLWADRGRIVNLKELISWIGINLAKRDVCQSIYNL